MEIIPAIDIRGGRCVRLYQGDFRRETVFHKDPIEVALSWQSVGAPRVHVIDLDGASAGKPMNMDIIVEIATNLIIPVQVGGGIRHLETIEELLQAGVDRVVLGTPAVEAPLLVRDACRSYGESIVVCVDTRKGRVAINAWQSDTAMEAGELAEALLALGVKRLIRTDIGCDGTLSGPNLKAISDTVDACGLPVIAAGGTSSLEELGLIYQTGVEGVIVGRALYTGDIDLKEALARFGSPEEAEKKRATTVSAWPGG